jgi:Protein of unknown function (DUF4239)
MNTILTSLTIFASIFGAALLGMAIRRKVPDEHLGSDAKDVIRLVTGITATTSALVLGMLVSNAKTYYDSWNAQVAEIASEVVTIDRLLADYGPDTDEIRIEFRNLVHGFVERTWPGHDPLPVALKPRDTGETLMHQVELLTPKDALQTVEKNQVVPMITSLRQAQWRMFARSQQTTMPVPLLVIVVSWQAVIFVSMALFAPRNATIFVTFALGALTISTAVLLILDMYSPFRGILTISSAPITDALSQMQH